jgi:prolyl oligopeptidase
MKKTISLFTAISFFSSIFVQYLYPPTKTLDSSVAYFGITYKDPYRWLENMKQQEAMI